MISKQYIKKLDFDVIEDIFEYIIESKINGNYRQSKELVNKLSIEQYNTFINWFLNTGCLFSEDDTEVTHYIAMRGI